ncbi:MAG: sulfite exporter TauE/SafE family protein [Hyphomonadaceae bacterium]|nr:sulfite exporter TauE/SafE family protein [Hyphomonadaceae bacterium]
MGTALANSQDWFGPEIQQYGLLIVSMLVAGLFAGFVAGMFGIGGGFVVVPALAAVLNVLPHTGGNEHIMHVAIGTSLATIFFTSLRSVQAHAKRGAVDWNILKGWLPWVVAGVIVGVALTSVMDGEQLKIVFGVCLIPLGLNFIFQILGRKVAGEEKMPKGPARAALGSGLGAFSSLLGIGGGTPAVLIMTMSGVNMHRAVATAAGFGTIIAVPGAIGSMIAGFNQPNLPLGSFGFVNLIALASIVAMSIWTAPLGAAAAHKLDPVKLKRVFGAYLLLTAGFMLKDSIPFGAIFSQFTGSA